MIADILTIAWKEFQEFFAKQPGLRGGWVGLLVFIVIFGVFLPLETGPDWVSSPVNLLYWSWVPFLMVSSVIADSFAGERERHTLETLLASRLSDRSILFGKLLSAIGYGWGLTLVSLFIGLLTVNLAYPGAGLLLFPNWLLASILGVSLLIAGFSATLGVLISLRAATVRQAQQTLSLIMFVPLVLILIIPIVPKDIAAQAVSSIMTANIITIVSVFVIGLFILDVILLIASMARFQRSRMILD